MSAQTIAVMPAMGAALPTAEAAARVALLMALIIVAFVSQLQPVIVAATALCAVYAWIACPRGRIDRDNMIRFAAACMLFFPAFFKAYQGFSPVFYFFATIATFFAAKAAAAHHPRTLLWAFRGVYVAALIAIAMILFTYWNYREPLGMLSERSSTNGIPAYLIVLQIGLSLTHFVNHGRLPVISPFATGAVAFFGIGRGSLVVAGLIIAGTLLFNLLLRGASSRLWRAGFLLLFAAVAATLVLHGTEILDTITRHTKLSQGLVDINRLQIWDAYIAKIDGLTLVFGADYAGTIIDSMYNGNPHNAYIRTHSFFGLPAVVAALLSPLLVLFARKTIAARLVFFYFIGLAALRATSEPILFPTLLDFFYFGYFLMFFRYAPALAPKGARFAHA